MCAARRWGLNHEGYVMCAARRWGLVERAHHISLIELSRGSLPAMAKAQVVGL